MADVVHWPLPAGELIGQPRRFYKAADHGLWIAVHAMERQWGTIETHNRLVEYCDKLRAKVEANKAEPPNPLLAGEFRQPVPEWI